ncbi:hypothetical protein [Paenibacillus profundus]|uniref:hypothetical protein n=1 Tax=Paenibacillus profundus TaxID=1173085 RepID=UPI001F46C3FB|nr:hypothetical protein [Paenibacillus profundus]
MAAWNTLQKIIPRTIKDKSWHCDGLDRQIMEICADLIIFYGKDHPVSAKIWAFAENGISKSVENMGLILYDKTIKASKLMGNDHLAQRLAKHRKKLEQR